MAETKRAPRDGEYAWIRWWPRNVPHSATTEIARFAVIGDNPAQGWWDTCGSDQGINYKSPWYTVEILEYIPGRG